MKPEKRIKKLKEEIKAKKVKDVCDAYPYNYSDIPKAKLQGYKLALKDLKIKGDMKNEKEKVKI